MIYYSLQSLSSILIDTLNFYFLPFISMYSFICNILMVIVFTNKRLNGDVYQYLLFDSLVGTFYFSISTFIFLIRCGVYCPYGYDYTSKFYELYLYFFIGKTVEVIIFLIDLYLCVIKYRAFSTNGPPVPVNKNRDRLCFIISISSFILISILINILPTFYGRTITQIGYLASNQTFNNQTLTKLERPLFIVSKSNLASNQIFNIILQSFTILQGLVLLLIIFLMNVLVTLRLRKFLLKKSTISSKFV